jgi:hypothetical protein
MFNTTQEAKSARLAALMQEMLDSATIENCSRENTHCTTNCQPNSMICRLNLATDCCNQQKIDKAWIAFQESNLVPCDNCGGIGEHHPIC